MAGLTIAWVLGVVTGLTMPFMVGFYNHVREIQRKRAEAEQFYVRNAPTVPILPQEPPILTSIGFRMVPPHRRVGRKPQRPQPRGRIVR